MYTKNQYTRGIGRSNGLSNNYDLKLGSKTPNFYFKLKCLSGYCEWALRNFSACVKFRKDSIEKNKIVSI